MAYKRTLIKQVRQPKVLSANNFNLGRRSLKFADIVTDADARQLRTDSQAQSAHMTVLARISPLIKQSSPTAQSLMQPSSLSFTLIAPNRSSLDEFATLVTQE